MTEEAKRLAAWYQNDAAKANSEMAACLRLHMVESACYWQGRASHYADMARFMMGLR